MTTARTMKDLVGEERMLSKVFKLKQNDQERNGIMEISSQQI